MTTGTGIITGVSIAHGRATLDQIDAAAAESERAAVESLLVQPGVSEAFALQTCNRTEAYVVTADPDAGRESLETVTAGLPADAVRELGHEASLRHLMRVAAGLESLVVGEDQIIGQVRDARDVAKEADALGDVLGNALTKAIHVGERARDETAINEGVVSLGSAAAELADRELDLENATALVVGAGEMSRLAALALAEHVPMLVVANRTVSRAEQLADSVPASSDAVGLGELRAVAVEADIIITATGSDDAVIETDVLADAGETLVIDIAQPRDVAPAAEGLSSVDVRDLDALQSVTERTRERRQQAAEEVEAMIDEEFEHLLTQYKRQQADEVIGVMYESAERMKGREVGKALSKLEAEADGDLTEDQRRIVESLADSLVGQLLAAPTKSLRDAAEEDDWTTINAALQLFDPQFDGDTGIPVPGAETEATEREGPPAAVGERPGEQ